MTCSTYDTVLGSLTICQFLYVAVRMVFVQAFPLLDAKQLILASQPAS